MKTTQLTSKLLVAALLLSVVSPVLAVDKPAEPARAPEFAKPSFWQKTKDFFGKTVRTEDEKRAMYMNKGIVSKATFETLAAAWKKDAETLEKEITTEQAANAAADVTEKQQLLADKKADLVNLEAYVKATDFEKAEKEKSFFKRQISDRANKLWIEHPDRVKYSAMTAVAAALMAGVATACYKYDLHNKAWNKIKSLFGFGKQALDPITAKAEELVNQVTEEKEVKENLKATVETEAIKNALNSVKNPTLVANVNNAVKNFDAKLEAVKTAKGDARKTAVEALATVQEELIKAVKAANEELKKQDKAGNKADASSSNAGTTTTTEPKKEDKTKTRTQAPAGMGAPRVARR